MNRIARMILMNNNRPLREDRRWDERRDERDRRRERTTEPEHTGDGYRGDESRFRDRRGREHYDDGRYAPQSYYGVWDGYNGERPQGSWYPQPGKITNPYYPDPRFGPYYDNTRGPEREAQPPKMNKIGFSVDGHMERYPDEFRHDYRAVSNHPRMDEIQHRNGEYMAGYSAGENVSPLDKETAEKWAQHMQNEDGTTGPHWTLEQTKQVQSQKGIDCEPLEFWLALNATYSDLSKVFKKHGIANIDAYVDFAKAFWLDDKDAQPDKLARYYEYVVKH